MKDRQTKLLLTCEHGGNVVPEELQAYFASSDARRHLNSHRGFDAGALFAATKLAERLDAPLVSNTFSRLVIDLNRSLESPQLFSKFVCDLDEEFQRQIIQKYYVPYRKRVTELIEQWISSDAFVLHLSIHTFAPRFRGTHRNFDVGVLFDPGRNQESDFSDRLVASLNKAGLQTFPNQPYLGTDDGLTTSLRKMFTDNHYAGIELELSNRFHRFSEASQTRWCEQIAASIQLAHLDD